MRFRKVVGTGGVGTGMLLLSPIQETLGRSESRLVTASEAKDYCKLHIVFHYIAAIAGKDIGVYPLSFVGQDSIGEELLEEMQEAGMRTEYMGRSKTHKTMLSVCLQYPDKEGCNMTVINSAANEVTPDYIRECMEQLSVDADTLVAAIPEVSVESRAALLREGKKRGAFCVLSVPEAEAEAFLKEEVFSCCDLLAVNEEEARALLVAVSRGEKDPINPDTPQTLVEALYQYMQKFHPGMALLVTFGKSGSYTMERGHLEYLPARKVAVKNTTGAGDACLGGTIAGLCMGWPLQSRDKEGSPGLSSAAELGTLCAGMAVQCEDTIAWAVGPDTAKR
jgi:sugar/nucleoside kinase (ribokinase family)